MSDWFLILLVFAAVAALAFGVSNLFGGLGGRRLRNRLEALADTEDIEQSVSAIRARYLRQLSPVERRLEELPGMATLGQRVEQAGWKGPAYRIAAISLGLTLAGAVVAVMTFKAPEAAVLGAVLAGMLPFLKLRMDRGKRLEKF